MRLISEDLESFWIKISISYRTVPSTIWPMISELFMFADLEQLEADTGGVQWK